MSFLELDMLAELFKFDFFPRAGNSQDDPRQGALRPSAYGRGSSPFYFPLKSLFTLTRLFTKRLLLRCYLPVVGR